MYVCVCLCVHSWSNIDIGTNIHIDTESQTYTQTQTTRRGNDVSSLIGMRATSLPIAGRRLAGNHVKEHIHSFSQLRGVCI